jgi:hypothetical protein
VLRDDAGGGRAVGLNRYGDPNAASSPAPVRSHLDIRPRWHRAQVSQGAQRFYLRHGFVEVERTDGAGNEEHAPDIQYGWGEYEWGAATDT